MPVRSTKKVDKLLGTVDQIPGDFIISNKAVCHHKNVNFLSDSFFCCTGKMCQTLLMQILPLVLREVSQYKIHNAGFQGLNNYKHLKEEDDFCG